MRQVALLAEPSCWLHCGFCVLCCFCLFVVQTFLVRTVQPRLVLNLWQSAFPHLSSAGIQVCTTMPGPDLPFDNLKIIKASTLLTSLITQLLYFC